MDRQCQSRSPYLLSWEHLKSLRRPSRPEATCQVSGKLCSRQVLQVSIPRHAPCQVYRPVEVLKKALENVLRNIRGFASGRASSAPECRVKLLRRGCRHGFRTKICCMVILRLSYVYLQGNAQLSTSNVLVGTPGDCS